MSDVALWRKYMFGEEKTQWLDVPEMRRKWITRTQE